MSDASQLEGMVTVTDFDAATGGDLIDINLAVLGQETLLAPEVSAIAAAATLVDAAGLAAAAIDTGSNDNAAFDYNGNAYILHDTNDNSMFDDGDGLIELTGVSVADLDGTNFLV